MTSEEILRKIIRILSYPVDPRINKRGWNVRTDEGSIEYAVDLARKAINYED